MSDTLPSFFVVPAYTFFDWGLQMPKANLEDYVNYFSLGEGNLNVPITIKVGGKKFPAKIDLSRQRSKKYPQRDNIRMSWNNHYDTKKALRKLFIYSYVTTIKKETPKLKELAEIIHIGGTEFRVKATGKQVTDFDSMFQFMEDKNLFEFWKDDGKKKEKSVFLNNAIKPVWHKVDDVKKFKDRTHVIYLLHHSKKKQFYVGKADKFGTRIKKGHGRIGLEKDWDQFMFFELNPEFAFSLKQLEDFAIRLFSSILENELGVKPLKTKNFKLVNKAPFRKK
jgi:hypothetical protein